MGQPPGQDLVSSRDVVHFAAGEREKTVTVSLLDDAEREGTELVLVLLEEIAPFSPRVPLNMRFPSSTTTISSPC